MLAESFASAALIASVNCVVWALPVSGPYDLQICSPAAICVTASDNNALIWSLGEAAPHQGASRVADLRAQ